MPKTYEEINERIRNREAVVVTAEEIIDIVEEKGAEGAAKEVDVVTTGTFGAMCSSGAFLNFGHCDPPIKMQKAWLNRVPAYCGIAAVDVYLGATELRDPGDFSYGGGHVIEDLVSGKTVELEATGRPTDCYPRSELRGQITLKDLNQAVLFNPRNAYQNYAAATNTSDRTLYTYMGKLLPGMGNATFSTAGQLSPLLNDPLCKTIGPGTHIFLGGGDGQVVWEGTQFNTRAQTTERGVPKTPARTLAVVGELKGMKPDFLRGVTMTGYGASMAVGVGVPIPVLDEDIVRHAAVKDRDIIATVFDYSVGSRKRPVLGEFSYEDLRSGSIDIDGKTIPTSPLSSYRKAREIADNLKIWIEMGEFLLSKPHRSFARDVELKPLGEKQAGGV
jgi:uncharacterized protein (DUF39 family)